MRFHQIAQFLDRRLLQHEIQLIRIPTRRNKHSMILCQIRIHPQTVTYHIGFRDMLQRLTRTDIHISTGNQCMQGIGYKEVAECILSGNEFPSELVKMRSRRYAKRQITFFKRFDNMIKYNTLEENEFEKLCKIIDKFLDN